MALEAKVLTFAAITSGGPTQDLTGTSFTPKAAIIWWSRATNTVNAFAEGAHMGMGLTDGISQFSFTIASEDGIGTSDTAEVGGTGALIRCLGLTGTMTTVDAEADFVQWLSNGMQITWPNLPAAAFDLHVLFLGGSDITNAKVGTFALAGATGNQNVTTVGFQPDFLLNITRPTTTDNTAAAGVSFNIGAATGASNQWAQAIVVENGRTAPDAWQYYNHSVCASLLSYSTGALSHTSTFVDWLSDGFTINNSSTLTTTFGYLALKGGSYEVGNATEPSGTGDQTITTNKDTKAVMIFGNNTGTADSIQAHANFSVGAGTSSSEMKALVVHDADNPASSNVEGVSRYENDSIYLNITANATASSSTVDDEASLSSVSSTGFVLNWSNIGNARPFRYITFGNAAEQLTPVEVPLILRYNLEQTITKQLTLRYNLEQEFAKALSLRYNVTTLVEKQLTARYNVEQQILKQLLLRYNLEQQITKPLTLRYDVIALVTKQLTLRYDVTKLIEKTLTLRHNLEQQIQKVLNLRYDVTKLVEKPLTVRYNLEQTIEQVLRLRYNLDAIVEKALTLRYNIEAIGLSTVEKPLTLRYDVTSLLEKSLTTRYSIEQEIQKTLSLRYDLAVLVEKALSLRYNLEQQIQKTLNLRYDVTSLVEKQVTLRYNLEQTIEKILTVRYDIESSLTVIEKALTLRYNLEQQITKELTARYDVANEVPPKSLTIRYSIEKTIEKALLLRYDIESALAAIEKALILRYNLEQQIPKQLTARYDINAKVPDKALTVRYDITKLIEKTLTLRHNIEKTIAKVLSLRYDVTALTEKPLTLRHNIEQLITKPLNLRYHITALTQKILNLRYNLEQTITKQLTARYNLEQEIPKPLTVRYNLEQQIIKPLTLRYDVTLQALKQLTLRYNLEQQILKDLLLRYDIEAVQEIVNVQVIRFQKDATGITNATQDVALSFTPKALIVFSDGNTADNTLSTHYQWIQGFSDGTNQACIANVTEDAVSTSDTHRSHRNDSVFIRLVETTGAVTSRATCTFGTNKVTFTWAQNDTVPTYITMMAYGGGGITNAKVNTVDVTKSGTGTQDYTGLGFNPLGDDHSVLFTMMAGRTTSGESAAALGSFGAATSPTKRWVHGMNAQDASSGSFSKYIYRDDSCLYQFSLAGAVDGYADFSAWINDGFRLNWVNAISDTSLDFSYLVLNCTGFFDVGTLSAPVVPEVQNVAVDVDSYILRGLLIGGGGYITLNTIAGSSALSMGVTDGTNQASIGLYDRQAVPTDSFRINDTVNVVHRLTSTGADNAVAHLTSFGTNQFTLTWTLSGAVRYFGYVVVAQAPGPPVELTKELILRYDISQQILKQLNLRYTLEGIVEKLLRIRYDIINTVSPKQLTLRYNITKLVEKQITLRYTIGQTIQKLLTLRYNLEQTITKQLTTRYNITKLIQKQLLLRYNIQKEIIKQLTLLYSSEAQLTKTLEILYQIQGWGARSQTISDPTYKEPLRCRIRFIDRKNPNKIHYTYDSFATDTRPFNLLSCSVRLAQGEIGAFSFSIEDSAKVVNLNNIGYNARVEIDVKKIAAEDWTRLMTGYVRRVQRVRSATNTLIYTVNGYGLQIVFNERVTNFKRAAKRTQVDSTDPLPTDSNMFASTLFSDLITATDIMPLKGPSLADQAGFTIDSINVDIKDFVAQIAPGLTDAAQVANALSELTGAIWGVNNEGKPFFRYPTQKHSGIIIKDDPADTDSAISTAINMGGFDFEDIIDLAEGFANRLYVLNAVNTKSTASSSKATGGTNLTLRAIAQQFTATDNNITSAAFILSKTGNLQPEGDTVGGYLRADNEGYPTGSTIVYFEIPFSTINTSKSTIFVNDIKIDDGVIIPGNKYWWMLWTNIGDNSRTVIWHHDNDHTTLNRFSALLTLGYDQDPTQPGRQLYWARSDKGPVYAFSTFSSIRHILEHSDPESIDRYGLVEGIVDLPAFADDATFQKALTQILKTSSKPKRIYEYNQVTIPMSRLFMPGELVTLIDSKTDLDSDRNVTAEISEVLYNFSTDSNAVGCKYVNLRAISFIDKILDDYLNSGAVCSE